MRTRQAKPPYWILLLIPVLFDLWACTADPEPEPDPTPPVPTALPAPESAQAAATPMPPACLNRPGRLQMVVLDSAPIPWFRIYLPPCYEMLSPRPLPVLYLFHGATYDDGQWVRLGAAETADHLIATAQAEPFIIIMPYNKASWRSPEDDPFDQAVLTDLIPYVDAHYRTLTDRSHRAVGGLSRGAGWALRLGFTRPNLFSAIGAHSPVVFYDDQFHLPGWLADLPAETRPAVYIDIGRGDKERSAASQLAGLLAEYEIPHTWHIRDGNHDETYWQAHIDEYLRWYTANW